MERINKQPNKIHDMKRILFICTTTLFIASCGNKGKSDPNTIPKDSTTTNNTVTSNYIPDSLLGEYIGGFGNSTIVVSVNYINGENASGYNIIKGNRRNIKGKAHNKGAYYEFDLHEPGGDPFDGNFKFKIDTATRTLKGTWHPFDSTKVKHKSYTLTKRKFNHDAVNGYVGYWYLSDLKVEFKSDKSGVAKGYWWNEKTESSEDVEIPFSWFEEKDGVAIEWGKNNIFLSSKMKFKRQVNEYEDMLQSGDYVMYRY